MPSEDSVLTKDALSDEVMTAAAMLVLGSLMKKLGLKEYTIQPLAFDYKEMPGIMLERDGANFTVKIVTDENVLEAKEAAQQTRLERLATGEIKE